MMLRRQSTILLLFLVAGCVNDEVRAPPQVVVAEFDPAATPPVGPSPTDLIRNPQTGRIELPLAPDAPQAARDFAAYLASLDAYPPMSRAMARFSAPVDPASLDGNVIVIDLTAGAPIQGVTATVDSSGTRLLVLPPGGLWPTGHTIAVAVIGYTGGVTSTAGQPVIASPAFFFARAERPISNCTTPAKGCTSTTPLLTPAQAASLEGLRQALAPLFDALAAAGVDRNTVALAWAFSVSKRPFAIYDPGTGDIPFPNDILRDPTTGLVQLPLPPDAPAPLQALAAQIDMLQGFSTIAPAVAHFAIPGRETLAPPGAGAVVTTIPAAGVQPAGDRLVIQPGQPLAEKTSYLIVVTRALTTTAGEAIEPPPPMAFLTSTGTLVQDGHSTVPVLSDEEAAQLEPLRQGISDALAAAGVPREQVVLAWSYTTQPTVSLLMGLIGALPPPTSTGADVPIPPGVPSAHIQSLRAGTFTGPAGDVPYLLVVPTGTVAGAVLFVHGLGTDKTAVLAIADPLAARGLAVASLDLPLSGDRAQTGHELLDPMDLLGTRDRLLQAATELEQERRLLAGGGLGGVTAPGTPAVIGVSIGGVPAADFAAATGLNAPIVLSTTGAGLAQTITESPTLGPMFTKPLTDAGLALDSPEAQLALILAQTLLDAADPANYAPLLPSAQVLVQVGGADQVIPPASGERLAALAGVPPTIYPSAGHSALVNPDDPAFRAMVTDAVRAVLAGGAP